MGKKQQYLTVDGRKIPVSSLEKVSYPGRRVTKAQVIDYTEDHPVEYLDFEGIIPKGQYGGGTVMVWDIGTYEPLEGNYYKGYLRIHLNGRKLKGEWDLVRSRDAERQVWYLIKTGASMRAVSKKRDDTSVLSDRSMLEIAEAADATRQSNRRGAA
jgi:bifunctional non-homologous end joining protein LigD